MERLLIVIFSRPRNVALAWVLVSLAIGATLFLLTGLAKPALAFAIVIPVAAMKGFSTPYWMYEEHHAANRKDYAKWEQKKQENPSECTQKARWFHML